MVPLLVCLYLNIQLHKMLYNYVFINVNLAKSINCYYSRIIIISSKTVKFFLFQP